MAANDFQRRRPSGELIPPPGEMPTVPVDATPAQCIAAWFELLDATEPFLLAGLRREIGPSGDLRAAYRKWYAQSMEDHDRAMINMLTELGRRTPRNAG